MYHWCITCNTDVSWTTSVIHPYLGWYTTWYDSTCIMWGECDTPYLGWYTTWYMYHARWTWYTVPRMIHYMIHVSCEVNVILYTVPQMIHYMIHVSCEVNVIHRTSDDTLGITTLYIHYTCINALNDDTCTTCRIVLVHMIHIWYTYDTCYTCIVNESFTMRPSRLWYVNDTWQYDVFLRRSPWVSFCSLVTPRYGIINVSAVYQAVYQVPILNNRPEDTSTAPCMPASAAWWHHDTYYTRIYNVSHCIITDPAVSDVIHVSLMYQLRITNMIHVRYMAQLYSMHIDGIIWYQLCIMCVFLFHVHDTLLIHRDTC